MICKKCGCEIKDEDAVYCPNCGEKVIKQNNVAQEEAMKRNGNYERADFNKTTRKKTTVKNKILIVVTIVIIAVIAVQFLKQSNKPIKVEASSLSKDISDDSTAKYKNKTLEVHGYLIRNAQQLDNPNYYYILVSDLNNYDFEDIDSEVIFSVDGGLDKSLGTGSELTITGKMQLKDDNHVSDMIIVASTDDIEIKKSVEPIVNVGDIDDLIDNSSNYIGKKITVTGVVATDSEDMMICNSDYSVGVILNGISEKEIYTKADLNTWVIVTGTFNIKGQSLIIKVDDIEVNDIMNDLNPDQVCKLYDADDQDAYSVDEILENPNCFIGKYVTVYGQIPQAVQYDNNGNPYEPLYADDSDGYILLEGDTAPYPWDDVHVFYNGTIVKKDGQLTLEIHNIWDD